jgi:hypothetical protein
MLAVNCPWPLEVTSRHGIATSCPPAVVLLPIPGMPTPVPLLVELLLPGAPVPAPLVEMTANWICPLVGSTTRSCTWPSDSPLWLFKVVFINLLNRTGWLEWLLNELELEELP